MMEKKKQVKFSSWGFHNFSMLSPLLIYLEQFNHSVQDELEINGLPPCDGVVNLAGENLMNPLRW